VDEAASRVRQEVDSEANIIVGATYDDALGDRIRVSIVASGMGYAEDAGRGQQASAESWISGRRGAPAEQQTTPPPVPGFAEAPSTGKGEPQEDLQHRL